MIKHEQVPFVTMDREVVSVDKDILEVMNLLRDLGVRTEFSCQEALQCKAYVLADWKSFSQLLRQIHRYYKRSAYSSASMQVVEQFLSGVHEYALSHFRPNLLECMFKLMFRRRKELNRYHIEYTYSNHYHGRITLRWPTENNHLVQTLLEETKVLEGSQELHTL